MKTFRALAVASLLIFAAVLAVGYSPPASASTALLSDESVVFATATPSAIPYGGYMTVPRGDSAAYALFTISAAPGYEGRDLTALSSNAPFARDRERAIRTLYATSRSDRAGPVFLFEGTLTQPYHAVAGTDSTVWTNQQRPVSIRT